MAVYLVLAAVTIAIAHLVDSKVVKKENSFFDAPEYTRGQIKNKIVYILLFFLLFAVSATRIAVGNFLRRTVTDRSQQNWDLTFSQKPYTLYSDMKKNRTS